MEAQTVYELFPGLPGDEIEEAFHRQSIEVPKTFRFAKVNIVTGANGSGKTRLLRALKSLYEKQDRNSVIYGYFPALSDRPVELAAEDEPPVTLFESISSGDIDFDDFFHEIERHNTEFLEELLQYKSRRRTEIQGLVVKSFQALTNKALIFREKQAFVKEADGEERPLSGILDRLSPGELTLFYMSIFLALRKDGAEGKAIILDEPESHLHPKALRTFIGLLIEQYSRASIWIATHSLFLVPGFQFENIVYIKDSAVQKRDSEMYRSILNELLGYDRATEDFFASLSQWQFCQFIAECFADPAVVDTVNPKDEQVQLFMRHLNEQKPMRVLDWGGGSARLGWSLLAAGLRQGVDFDYHIYDINPRYSGGEFTVFKNLEDIQGTYHCVVMMNFLHELEPPDWPDAFARASELLEDGGFLLFIEVKTLRDGEMPSRAGYLLLGPEEVEKLFPGGETFQVCVERKSIGVLVPKEALRSVDGGSVDRALQYLRTRSFRELKALRETEGFPKAPEEARELAEPRRYAFAVQQYINAKLAAGGEEEETFAENLRLKETLESALAEKEGLESSCRELEEQVEDLEEKNNFLGKALAGLRAEKERLEAEHEELKESEKTLREVNKYLSGVVNNFGAENRKLESERQKIERGRRDSEKRIRDLEKNLADFEAEKEQLAAEHEELKKKEEGLIKKNSALGKELLAMGKEKNRLELRNKGLEASWILTTIKLVYTEDDAGVQNCIQLFSLAVEQLLQGEEISKAQYMRLANAVRRLDMKQSAYQIGDKNLDTWFKGILNLIGEQN